MALNITNESAESYDAYKANLNMAEELGVVGTLDRYNLDALVMPTFAAFHLPAIAGLPVITVPLGFFPPETPLVMNLKGTMVNIAPNVPFGISFVGRRWSEETLISLAYAFEQRTLVRQKMKPYIRPSFQLGDQVPQAAATATAAMASSQYGTPSSTVISMISADYEATFNGSTEDLVPTRTWAWGMLGMLDTLRS